MPAPVPCSRAVARWSSTPASWTAPRWRPVPSRCCRRSPSGRDRPRHARGRWLSPARRRRSGGVRPCEGLRARGRRSARDRRVVGPEGLLRRLLGRRVRRVRPPGGTARPSFVQPGADLVVEEYLDLVENWCVHFCVEAIGAPRLLGATERLISATCAYGGSRVGGTVLPPAAAKLCQAVAGRARALGLIGYCGNRHRADVLRRAEGVRSQLPDQREQLQLCWSSMRSRRARGHSWTGRGRWQTYRHSGSLPDLVNRLKAVYAGRALVPIASYDPAAGRGRPGPGPGPGSGRVSSTTEPAAGGAGAVRRRVPGA